LTAADRPQPARLERDKEKDRQLVGKVVAGKYKVLEVLGQGGFGTVFLVEMTTGIVGDRLAMKILPRELSENPLFREQFLNEIRTAMKLVDKHIVQIRDVGVLEGDELAEKGGLLYYTMDHVRGKTLAQILRETGPLPPPRAMRIVRRILPALVTAHANGIIHRDLKPANVMVETTDAGKDNVRVLDFGIARAVGDDEAGAAAASGSQRPRSFAGSPYYMPPEQFTGSEMGFYTDLYSVGVILYECLTGERPYQGSTPQEVYNAIKRGPPVPVEELAPGVRAFPGLAELVAKALERNPEKRHQSAKEFYDEINAIIGGKPDTAGEPTVASPADGPRGGAAGTRSGPVRRPGFAAPGRRGPARRRIERDAFVARGRRHRPPGRGRRRSRGDRLPGRTPQGARHAAGAASRGRDGRGKLRRLARRRKRARGGAQGIGSGEHGRLGAHAGEREGAVSPGGRCRAQR
jgi:serine/threonine-protein kinase